VTRFGCLPPRLDGEQTKSGCLPANLDSAKEFGFGARKRLRAKEEEG
jgi:hypothetical protein